MADSEKMMTIKHKGICEKYIISEMIKNISRSSKTLDISIFAYIQQWEFIMLALTEAGATGGMTIAGILVYVVVIAGLFYFMLYRPQKKQQQKAKAMLDTLEVGDSVLTSSGFYGVVIDITDDTVIVEFGNNKNCRIPMQKAAIVQLEKAES